MYKGLSSAVFPNRNEAILQEASVKGIAAKFCSSAGITDVHRLHVPAVSLSQSLIKKN